jgi:hypothetical protein
MTVRRDAATEDSVARGNALAELARRGGARTGIKKDNAGAGFNFWEATVKVAAPAESSTS